MFPAIMAELRHASFSGSPQTYLYLEVGGTLLSFCYAANALVRFRGTHDRTALILAFGFVISGIIETAGYFGLNELSPPVTMRSCQVPTGWMVGRTLLAVLLLAAVAVERFMPTARQPSRETAGALLVVAIAAYLTSAAFLAAPSEPFRNIPVCCLGRGTCSLQRLFLFAALCFYRRLKNDRKARTEPSLYDHTLFIVRLAQRRLPRFRRFFPPAVSMGLSFWRS